MSDKIHRTLVAASRGERPIPPPETVATVMDLLCQCYNKDIIEFKVVWTRRGMDAFITRKERL